jgi:hypothetical protein
MSGIVGWGISQWAGNNSLSDNWGWGSDDLFNYWGVYDWGMDNWGRF